MDDYLNFQFILSSCGCIGSKFKVVVAVAGPDEPFCPRTLHRGRTMTSATTFVNEDFRDRDFFVFFLTGDLFYNFILRRKRDQ